MHVLDTAEFVTPEAQWLPFAQPAVNPQAALALSAWQVSYIVETKAPLHPSPASHADDPPRQAAPSWPFGVQTAVEAGPTQLVPAAQRN
jgi:hypothetical protein